MQVATDREVVAGKCRLKEIPFVWTNIKRNNMMLY
jgi:hypothetical protein